MKIAVAGNGKICGDISEGKVAGISQKGGQKRDKFFGT
jgi:hypothetical protein